MDTPPPITITSGSTTQVKIASAVPRYSANLSTICFATPSPSLYASKMVFALKLSRCSFVSAVFSAMIFLPILTIPVAEAICSRQPLFPQLQLSVSSGSTQACPISPPAPCAPVTILPSTIMPPPTPVPSVAMIRFFVPSPPPFHISPRAATLASFPTFTGI